MVCYEERFVKHVTLLDETVDLRRCVHFGRLLTIDEG